MLGFGAERSSNKKIFNDAQYLQKVMVEDIISFGMIPELVGRIPVITALNELSKEDLVKILTEPKNAIIKQYSKLFSMDEKELVIEPDAIEFIAEEAFKMRVGARALKSVMERTLSDFMFDCPTMEDKKIIITKDFIAKKFAKEKEAA
jgi:ATP-dependent Clp protease ATP-binding subunit ClpX